MYCRFIDNYKYTHKIGLRDERSRGQRKQASNKQAECSHEAGHSGDEIEQSGCGEAMVATVYVVAHQTGAGCSQDLVEIEVGVKIIN